MSPAEARRRFAQARIARLATVSAGGQPHVVPVVFAVSGDTVVFAVDHKPKRTTKLRRLANIAETGAVSLLVDHYDDDWDALWWVRADGHGEVVSAESEPGSAAIDTLVTKYPQYANARPSGPAVIVGRLRWRWWSAGEGIGEGVPAVPE